MSLLEVHITVPSLSEAGRIADTVVSERLAACAQQLPGVRSTYVWDGEVVRETEVLLTLETTSEVFDPLARRVRELHSADVPHGTPQSSQLRSDTPRGPLQIVASVLTHVDPGYAEWVRSAVTARPSSHLEVERKFALAAATLPPDPVDWPGVSAVAGERRFHLRATYFDSDDMVLATQGITMRRRDGGTDAGWHLKLPRTEDAREEQWLPLDATSDETTVPDAFRAELAALLDGRELHPVCQVQTRRTEWDLTGGGVLLATTCDDYVTTHNLLREEADREWHELEVELVHGGTDFLDRVTDHLERQGVHQASISSKLRAAMGSLLDAAPS